jgi:pimeloyl-ACP methyl ester carboxylesterase
VQQQLSEIRMSDGTVISYTVFDGAAPAVVILHGLAGSSREFVPTSEALPGRWKAVRKTFLDVVSTSSALDW